MAEFKQMRRHIPEKMLCRSETMYRYLRTKGGQLVGATQRVATMYESTEDNEENRKVVISIFDGLFETLEDSQAEFQKQVSAFKRDWNRKNRKSAKEFPKTNAPDTHSFTFEITHPIFQRMITAIRKMDNSMTIMETLWMMGELEEQHYVNARIKMGSTISRFTNEIFSITNKLRTLDPGRGNTRQRINNQIDAQLASVTEPSENEDASMLVSEDGENSTVLVSSDANPLETEEIGSVLSSQEALKESA